MSNLILSLQPFNNDQLNGLADLCFDLAKAAFIGVLLTPTASDSPTTIVISALKGLTVGLASTYTALILLKIKTEAVNLKT